MRFRQDLQPGKSFNTSSLDVTHEDILEFAAEFDPQPYHLDSNAARESIFGGLCASGWQVTALMMRLVTDTLLENSIVSMGSSGVRKLRWKQPVFAGDTLLAKLEVTACGKPDQDGLSAQDFEVTVNNQNGKPVLITTITLLIQMIESEPSGGAN